MQSATEAPEATIHTALTGLMAQWASPATQSMVALEAGVEIDPFDIAPLYSLGTHGSVRASDLAHSLQISRPTMSKQLARLESRGLVQREPDGRDGRARIVRLTASGAAAHARLVARGHTMLRESLHAWDSTEIERFAAQLERFVADLSTRPPTENGGIDSSDRTPAGRQTRPTPGSQNGVHP